MMDHNNMNNDTHNNKKDDTPQVSDVNTTPDNPIENETVQPVQDDFFTASDDVTPKNQSRSVLVIVLIIAFSAILGLLIFSYIYDLAGMRTFANEYTIKEKNSVVKTTTKQYKSVDIDKQSDDDLNASLQVKNSQKETHNKPTDSQQTNLKTVDTHENPSEKADVQIALPIIENNNLSDVDILSLKSVETDSSYQEKTADLHKIFKNISNQFLLLNQKLMQSEPYLDILIDIRSHLKTQNINVPTLTEYASAGFPTDMIIATDAMKLLKKLSIIAARKHDTDTFWSFIKNFAIITPQSNTQGLTGVYRKIGKALDDGDFNGVEQLIGEAPIHVQKDLRELYILVSDKKAIYAEIKLLNDTIIDNAFEQADNNMTD